MIASWFKNHRKRSKTFSRIVVGLTAVIMLCLAGWRVWSEPASPSAGEPLTVAAATSLQPAFTEIGRLFEMETGQPVVFSFGSTGNLARQIEHGAPMDVFAAANMAYVKDLQTKELVIASSKQLFAQGQVVLVINRASGVQAECLEDLLQPAISHITLANPNHAPYGQAAKQALQNAGLWDALRPKLIYGENVRQAMQFVQTGNAKAGLIALSLANAPELSHTLVDADLHQHLNQVMVVVRGTPQEAAARRFIAFVTAPQSQTVMRRYGFRLPE